MVLYILERSDGPWEGSTVHAVCLTREDAHKARVQLFEYMVAHKMVTASSHSKLKRKMLKGFFIRQIVPNTVYPFGVEMNDQILIEGKKS